MTFAATSPPGQRAASSAPAALPPAFPGEWSLYAAREEGGLCLKSEHPEFGSLALAPPVLRQRKQRGDLMAAVGGGGVPCPGSCPRAPRSDAPR